MRSRRLLLAMGLSLPLTSLPGAATPEVEGLWRYVDHARAGGTAIPTAGLFLLKGGTFLQQSISIGDPLASQLAQAHAGSYRIVDGKLYLDAEVGFVVDGKNPKPVEQRHGSQHVVTPERDMDRLLLTFGRTTRQRFLRAGAAAGTVINFNRGGLALCDGQFLLVSDAPDRAVAGFGRATRSGDAIELEADFWMTIVNGLPTYQQSRRIAGTLTATELILSDGTHLPRRPASAN